MKKVEFKPKLLDFTELALGADKTLSIVSIDDLDIGSHEWLRAGEVNLSKNGHLTWTLEAVYKNVKDREDGSARCYRIELIGVELSLISYGVVILDGFISRSGFFNTFCVPKEVPSFKKNQPKRLDNYLPPHDQELEDKLSGAKVSIKIVSK